MAISESGGVKHKTGGWRIMIGGAPGASVFGGTLAGSLIAASPVQVRTQSIFFIYAWLVQSL